MIFDIVDAMAVDNSVVHKYQAGFTECAGEVNRYLRTIDGLDPKVRDRLLGHLAGCVQRMNAYTAPTATTAQRKFPTNPVPQRLPSNPAATFTSVANHQAASLMSPLQVCCLCVVSQCEGHWASPVDGSVALTLGYDSLLTHTHWHTCIWLKQFTFVVYFVVSTHNFTGVAIN